MPLQRSPNTSPLKQAGSAPNLTEGSGRPQTDERSLSGTQRFKRKHGDDFESFAYKMEKLFNDWTSQQDKKMQIFLEQLREQNAQISTSIEFVSKQYEETKNRLDDLEKERKNYNTRISSLEERIENLERTARLSSLEMRNIPSKSSESAEDLFNYIVYLGNMLNVEVKSSDVKNIFRISNKQGEIKPIIIEFTSVSLKEKILRAIKDYKKRSNGNFVKTTNLHIAGPAKNIYISESLTPMMKRLHYLTREFAKNNHYQFCWLAHGKIYIRRKEGENAVRISCEMDLENLKHKK